jgi:hypothetical protein
MKKMKLFPKTFLYTFFMLLFITTSMHLMIYFFLSEGVLKPDAGSAGKENGHIAAGDKKEYCSGSGADFF